MSQTTAKEVKKNGSSNLEAKGLSAAAWAAIGTVSVAMISCISAMIAAALNPDLVNIISDKFFNPSPTPISQAVTLDPATPTLSPPPSESPIDIPEPAQSPVTPFIVGEDWQTNCITSANWLPYLAGDHVSGSEPCYNLVDWGIAANNGNLYFNRTGIHNNTALEYGILTDIRGKTRFEFSVLTKELSSSEVWLGFLEGDTPKSDGVVVVIQHDDNIDVRPLPKGVEFVDNVHFRLAAGKYDSIGVEFKGATITVVVDKIKVLEHPIDFVPTKLFLGYRALPNAEIEAIIYNVEVE